jgi:hypothetical protein
MCDLWYTKPINSLPAGKIIEVIKQENRAGKNQLSLKLDQRGWNDE